MNKVDPNDMMIIGVDSALKGLAVAVLDRDLPVQLHLIKPDPPAKGEKTRPSWDRIVEIRERWVNFLTELPRPPTAIWVESAIVVNASNTVALATVVAVVRFAVEDIFQMRAMEVGPSSWKKELTGFGDSKKNPIIDFLKLGDPELGERLMGYNQADRSDLADAVGIARFGKQAILKAIN